MAASENDDDISLLEGAKKVSEAVARILNTAKALAEDPNSTPPPPPRYLLLSLSLSRNFRVA